MRALRIGVPVAAFGWLLAIVPLSEVRSAVLRLSVGAVGAAIALAFSNTLVATLRWRILLDAYGAEAPPRLGWLWRRYLVAGFYGTFLPGGVGGDVVRGIACRDAFGAGGITASMGVVFVDRALGLAGLLILTAVAFTWSPLAGVQGVLGGALVGLAAVLGAIVSLAFGPRIANLLPGAVGRLAAKLPRPRSVPLIACALLLSLATQSVVAATGHVLISALADPSWLDSLAIVPLAGAAQYLPITIAGAGAREAAYVVLYRAAGVADADALTASLGVLTTQIVVAAVGGLVDVGGARAKAEES